MKTIKSGKRGATSLIPFSQISVLGDSFVRDAADHAQPDYAGCMTGTRVAVLSKFMKWVKDDPLAILWLAGMAGTGKTSIAVSLCRMLREEPTLLFGGGFFCSRSAGSITRTDVRAILPTLAMLLAGKSQEFAEMLASELEKDQYLGHKPVGEQIGPLLRSPLGVLSSSTRPIVFVIDALDECNSEQELSELLKLIADLKCDAKVKFILTSRPELHIRDTPISNSAHNTILQLHTINVEEVTSDIQLYIRGTLEASTTEAAWYSDHDVDLLVSLSAGLFIFASTVLKYVLQRKEKEDRQDRLRKATSAVATRSAAISAVNKVYELVLADASQSEVVDEEELERMKNILACILTARTSLSVEALAALVDVTPGRLRGALERLHSLVFLPDDDSQPGPHTLHSSFGDYLFGRGRVETRISKSLGHDILARGCLKRLAGDDLCFNISRSDSSFRPNPKRPPDALPLSLAYACMHWAHHIESASIRSAFDVEIARNFRTKFLFWLEALSVLGKIGVASVIVRIARSAVSQIRMFHLHPLICSQIENPLVSQFLGDADTFIASSYEAINRSAAHIYISALPFAAKDSLVFRDFVPLCTGIVSVTTTGIECHGSRLVATLTGHTAAVRSVAYSPNGRHLVSGSDDKTVRIWDTENGAEIISPLQSADGFVYCVAFSPNGQYIAAGTYHGVVYVWGVSNGSTALHRLRGHSNSVLSVAYSTDGILIASSSGDATIRLWNATTGLEVSTMIGHTERVNAVAFSPN